MLSVISKTRLASYFLAAFVLFVAARFHMGWAVIAGLFAFMLLDQGHEALLGAGVPRPLARWASLGLFAVVLALLAVILTSFVKVGLAKLPVLLDTALPKLGALAERFGVDLPADNVQELHALVAENLKANMKSITSAGDLLTRGFFQILIAIIIAALRFMSPDEAGVHDGRGLDAELRREFFARASLFARSFERVMGAQITIAAINAVLAAVFLFAFSIPFRTNLTLAAFLCGLVPIVGNLVSNSLIVAAALTVSDRMAVAALIFLVLVHKGGYILYGRIVGARIDMSTWSILIGILAGEAVLGIAGVILAPTVIYYVREELRAIPAHPRA
jgi:predicted PurR-regulated permease PerM